MKKQNPFSPPTSAVGLSEQSDYGWVGSKFGFWFALPFSLLSIGALISAAFQTTFQPLWAFVITIPAIATSTACGWWWGEKGPQLHWMTFIVTGLVQGIGFLAVVIGIFFTAMRLDTKYKVPFTSSDAVALVFCIAFSIAVALFMGVLVRWRVSVLRKRRDHSIAPNPSFNPDAASTSNFLHHSS